MRILILGGNGRTGKLVIAEALKRGHTVTALVRNPSSLEARSGLTIVEGTPLSRPDIESAFAASPDDPVSAVIVTLNASRTSDNPFAAPVAPPRMMADSHANLVAVMRTHNVHKAVTMSAFGVADSFANMNILLRLFVRWSNMALQFEDHGLVDKEMKASGVDFVLVRPTMLAEGDPKAVKEWGALGKGVGLSSKVTRSSVAGFMVDAAEKTTWDNSTVVITN